MRTVIWLGVSVIKRELAHQIPVVRRYVAHTSRRWAELLEQPDRTTLAQRARARFSDHHPGWPISVFHSADVQIAAAAVDAVERGDYRIVIGDYHPGTSPLGQGVFSYRHPDRQRFLETWGSDAGTPTIYPWPPRLPRVPMTARLMPATTLSDDIAVPPPMPQVRAGRGPRIVSVVDLLVDGETIADRDGSFRAPLHALFSAPMFVASGRDQSAGLRGSSTRRR